MVWMPWTDGAEEPGTSITFWEYPGVIILLSSILNRASAQARLLSSDCLDKEVTVFSKRWILVAAGVVLLAVTGTRGDPGATQTLHLAMDVFDSAGGCMQSAELRHFFTLSEPAVGRSTNHEFRLWSGRCAIPS